jgi:hypothetical protein
MATTTVFENLSKSTRDVVYGIATVDINETSTLDIPCGGRSVVRLGIPTIDSATVTFTVQAYSGAAFRTLKNEQGDTITIPASTGGYSVQVAALSGCYAFRIVLGSSQSTAAREIEVQCVGQNPIPVASFVRTDEIA